MNSWWIIVGLGCLLLIALIGLVWRRASARASHPLPVWLSSMVEFDNPFTKINRAATLLKHLQVQPGMRVADIGCGPGRNTIPIAKLVGLEGKVSAIDLQIGMLTQVEIKATQADLHNIECLQVNMGEGSLSQNHYDRALLVTVIGEIPQQEAALREVHSALKTGGRLLVTEVIFDPHFQSQKKIRRLAQTVGFTEIACYGGKLAYSLLFSKT